jgi:hypothetical protein
MMIGALAVATMLAAPARADEWNKQTFLTFSGPVQVPGATLPAGTYQFKLADLQGNRHVVQIFDKDGTKLYTTILAIPDQRLEPTDKPVVMFGETPAGTPAAIKAWFYPGDTIGDEFVYPRSEAMRIAKATHQPVLSRSDDSSDMKSSEVSRVDESGNTVAENDRSNAENEHAKAQPPANTATTTTGSAAENQNMNQSANQRPNADQNKAAVGTSGAAAPSATDQTPAQPRSGASAQQPNRPAGQANPDQNAPNARRQGRLPKTASPLALYELVTGLAFAGAFGIRQLRSRR